MCAKLKVCAALAALAVIAISDQTARAAQNVGIRGVQVSWDGHGEIQYLPDDDGQPAFGLRLTGSVVARGKQFEAKADRLTFDPRENLLTLESDADGGVRLSCIVPDDGPRVELAAHEIALSLSDSRISVEGAGTLGLPGDRAECVNDFQTPEPGN